MRWDEINSDEFSEKVRLTAGVCLIPVGCLERHAHHLPLGTDMLVARALCEQAAAQEEAIVFNDFFFTQILEARHYPGAFGLEPHLILDLLEATCREIARNGLKKIILVNAHGGNHHFLRFFAQGQLTSPRDYVVYVTGPELLPEDEEAIQSQWESQVDGHAGEEETSLILGMRPDLVQSHRIPQGNEGDPLHRLKFLSDHHLYTGIWWYADQPTHYRGQGAYGTSTKGQRLLQANARALAQAIRVVKADDLTLKLQDEFYHRQNLSG